MPATQKSRLLAIKTVLGEDKLLIRKFSMSEQIGRPFQIEVDLRSHDRDIKFEDIVGTPALIRLALPSGKTRYFSGHINRFVQVGDQGGYGLYQATLVPWIWFLTRTSDCRIFQKKMVPDIIEEVFQGGDFSDYKLKKSGDYAEWEYCVQYRETDFNFVSRLMEQEGLYYYFEHTDQGHWLVMADSLSAHTEFEDYGTLIFRPPTDKVAGQEETVSDWVIEKEIQPGQYSTTDYNFTIPKTSLLANANISRQHSGADYEIYDYPGEYEQRNEGESYAKIRIEEFQARYEVLRGQTPARGMVVGSKFALQEHPRKDQNREYLITGISIHAGVGEYASRTEPIEEDFFSCGFTAIPLDEKCPYRPSRVTPKPLIRGPQTAVVVGPKGEEIHTEEHARVKVQFHWDRYGKFDENSSCWIRVSQPWAGKGWGSMSTPRIGQEVIVEFLEGDPDQPIITGRVYNADQVPPYAGGQGVVSGLKSNTHKGKGYNEMSMDDTAGKEKITIHAQYDMGTTVEHDATHTVVSGKFTETIKGDTKITIQTGKYEHEVSTGIAKYTVQDALTEKYNTTQETTVAGNITIKSDKGDILIEGKSVITLHTGDSKITMDNSGNITISGKKIAIIGDDSARVSSKKTEIAGSEEAKLGTGNQNVVTNVAKTAIAGAAINASAVGMHEISGAVVKIN